MSSRRTKTAASFRHRNLPLLLLQAREGVIAHFRPILNEHGLTEQQWRILRALLEHGPLEPRQLGETCRISSPSLAGVLARMDELGLVARERLAEDARRVRVSLTPRSRALAAAIEAHVGADTIEQVYTMLDALVGRLAGLPPPPSSEPEA